jgi:hypothetical protein
MRYLILIMLILLLAGCYAPQTTTSWTQSSSATCTGWFCRATATTVISPTAADEIVGMLALLASCCVVILCLAFVGYVAGWWNGGDDR